MQFHSQCPFFVLACALFAPAPCHSEILAGTLSIYEVIFSENAALPDFLVATLLNLF